MKFGDYIRQKREHAGWTQPEAAARAGIEQSYLSKLETGKSYPSEDIFAKLVTLYAIDVAAMSNEVGSGELEKLREISDVRSAVLVRQKNETRFMRGWLIAGFLMIMVGGASLGLAHAIPSEKHHTFQYRSEGVILPGESPMIFSFLAVGGSATDDDENPQTLTERVDYDYKSLETNKGPSFIEKVEGGHRAYKLYDTQAHAEPSPLRWLFGPGAMFLFGGLACFYIARRWR